MSTLASAEEREALSSRFQRLSPEARPLWGRMTAPQMLAHCTDAMRMGLGDLAVKPKHASLPRMAVVKWLFLNVLPFPKDAPTAKELLARTPAPWDEERAHLIELIGRVGNAEPSSQWPEHPLFGALSGSQWAQLTWKHLDHHLRQFGA